MERNNDILLAAVNEKVARAASIGNIDSEEVLREIKSIVDNAELSSDTALIKEYKIEETPPMLKGEFPSGIDTLDRILDGGLRRGELGYVSAGAKVGKTTFLISRGAHLYKNYSLRIAHLSLEIYTDMVHQRYTENLLLKPYNLVSDKDIAQYTTPKGELFMVDMVHDRTIRGIEAIIQNIEPDVVIVDYADLVHAKSNQRFSELGLVYESLRLLGRKYDAAIWTASRLNRMGEEAESYLKSYACDVHLKLTLDEEVAGSRSANMTVEHIRRRQGSCDSFKVVYMPSIAYIGG